MSLTAKLIWYVEAHLNRPLSLTRVARATGAGTFHVTRLFAALYGRSLMAYVRGRRLTEAARHMAAGGEILQAALGAGYASHEAFSRAFRREFGVTPKALRLSGNLAALSLTEPHSMNEPHLHSTQPAPQKPRRVRGTAMTLAGISGKFDFANLSGIPAQWQAFRPWFGQVEGQVGGVCYGVSYNFRPDGIDYMCAVEIEPARAGDLPEGFSKLSVSAADYAVFEHHGHVSGISQTWRRIYDQWLPAAGLSARYVPSFERMDARYDGQRGMGVIEIWVPVG